MTRPSFGAAYTAERAAGLSGVPRSTLYYWARKGIWVPSVSAEKEKRWSYGDLLALRLIDWLRHEKEPERMPATSMRGIREALSSVEQLGEQLAEKRVRVRLVAGSAEIGFQWGDGDVLVPLGAGWKTAFDLPEVDLLAPTHDAPDLARPAPTLRIIPGKLAGEPHVDLTRVGTQAIAALVRRGFSSHQIVERAYPFVSEQAVTEAVALEEKLQAAPGDRAA